MTHPIETLMREATNHARDVVRSIQSQAPAARMIGEFAVKHLALEINKRTERLRGDHSDRDHNSPDVK